MVDSAIVATQAHVTLDVAAPGIIWGWIITMNMWAKSIGTGVIFLGAYLLHKYPNSTKSLKISMPIISLVFIHIFLFFTVIDLHQIFRFVNIFFHPHFTSSITVGAWCVTALVLVLFGMAYASILKKDDELFSKLMKVAIVLAIPSTLYTAVIMGQSTARELWQAPTEMVQMILAATLAGSATLLLISKNFEEQAKRDLLAVLVVSAFLAFITYMGEYFFGPMKAEEVGVILEAVKSGGEYSTMFWLAMTAGFIIPMVLGCIALKERTEKYTILASVLAIVGLWMAKHVWLVIPQLLPLS